MTSKNFPTLHYDHVTNSFLLEICFWGPTYPTFLYDVTLLDLFFLNSSLMQNIRIVLDSQDPTQALQTRPDVQGTSHTTRFGLRYCQWPTNQRGPSCLGSVVDQSGVCDQLPHMRLPIRPEGQYFICLCVLPCARKMRSSQFIFR